MNLALSCQHYINGDCRSCQWLNLPYAEQIALKQQHLSQQLAPLDTTQLEWQSPLLSPEMGFRNKAKMVVSGSVERPILGLGLVGIQHNNKQSAVDLTNCLLYPTNFNGIFPIIKDFIGRAGLVPYNIAKQKGELKYILLTESRFDHSIMLRFVLRSENKLPLMQRELVGLMQKLPQLKVVSANIQPQHAAILEGEKEIFLTENQILLEQFNQVPLYIRPQSFFQTNPTVAEQLYATAQRWVEDLPIVNLWDLFCGVGGFGLHCASALQAKTGKEIHLTGIEIAEKAIESATLSAQQLGLSQVKFQSLDSAHFALNQQQNKPDLVVVNPPRRGIGKALAQYLNQMQPHFLLYSSCNAVSMAKDLGWLDHYQMKKIQLFDMFPHTDHYETLLLLERCS